MSNYRSANKLNMLNAKKELNCFELTVPFVLSVHCFSLLSVLKMHKQKVRIEK